VTISTFNTEGFIQDGLRRPLRPRGALRFPDSLEGTTSRFAPLPPRRNRTCRRG
jgi:hypothetical protein